MGQIQDQLAWGHPLFLWKEKSGIIEEKRIKVSRTSHGADPRPVSLGTPPVFVEREIWNRRGKRISVSRTSRRHPLNTVTLTVLGVHFT